MKAEKTTLNRILVIIMVLCLTLCFSACNNDKEAAQTAPQNHKNTTADAADKNTDIKNKDAKEDTPANDTKQQGKQDSSVAESDNSKNSVETIAKDEKKELEQSSKPATVSPTVDESKQDKPEQDVPRQDNPSSEKAEKQMDYATYAGMSADDQYAFYKTFEDPEEFFSWYNAAKDEYEETHPAKVINSGDVINLGE